MSRARYDNRSGYSSFFGGEAIAYGKGLHDKYYGAKDGCPDWDEARKDHTTLKNFSAKSAGARTLTIQDGANGAMANSMINIGGRQYKTDSSGSVRLLGKDWVQNEVNIIQERQEFLNNVARTIIWGGDQMAVEIMGLHGFYALSPFSKALVQQDDTGDSAKGYATQFWKGVGNDRLEDPMLKIEARPSRLKCLPSSSGLYAEGLNKIFFILDELNIAFDEDVVHAGKIGSGVEHVAKTAPVSVGAPADAVL